MDFRIFTEPQQGASYDELLAIAQRTEQAGFDAFFRSDHYLRMGDGDPGYGPTDAWTSLAGLARETERIRLGTLVSSVTYRVPGILAVQVANVDQMSGGRVELGLGTGWFAEEHAAYGIPFPAQRFGLLEEQLEVVTGLWQTPAGERYAFDGEHYTITDSPALPKPVQDRVPVIVGGFGKQRTPALAARYATEFNIPFGELDAIEGIFANVKQAVADSGRADDLVYSTAFVACIGQTEADFVRRAERIGREPAELREHGIAGTPGEAAERIAQIEAAGSQRIYLQVLDMTDLDHVDELAALAGV